LISAALWPGSVPARAYSKAVAHPHEAFVCSYTLFELQDVFNRKFPLRKVELEEFIADLKQVVSIVQSPDPGETTLGTPRLRDPKDEPILYAALQQSVDYLITGDKDLLEAGLDTPVVITADQFLRL
jgi:putative PIN family toxin of toxin-antitoxin system